MDYAKHYQRLRKIAKGVKWTPERIAKRTVSRLKNKVGM